MIEKWIDEIRQGNRDAFVNIVSRYQSYIFNIIYPIVQNQKDTEDIAQETFIQVYRSLSHYRGNGFKTWIARIAVRKAIDWKRKNQKGNLTLYQDLDQELKEPSLSPDDGLEQKEEVEALLNKLPPPYRRTVQLYYLEDRTYQEIAEAEGVSVKTIESRLYRAKKMLRDDGKEELP
ncbi:MAG: RNA polymerase sigma factor [Bacillaceae bacterium]|nr:RNA polymerase sigma factor [Bacillaceae bacterium]